MDIKIGIGIPNTGSMKIRTVLALIQVLASTPHEFQVFMQTGCYVHVNREDIARLAIKNNCSHLMFIDTDVEFPPDGINKLLAMKKDIAGARYNLKRLPATSTIKFKQNGQYIAKDIKDIPTTHFQCAAVPTGFMLIDIKVFQVLKEPWFWYEYDEEKKVATGEDVLFCEKALAAGFEVWCDPTIPVAHWGDYPY